MTRPGQRRGCASGASRCCTPACHAGAARQLRRHGHARPSRTPGNSGSTPCRCCRSRYAVIGPGPPGATGPDQYHWGYSGLGFALPRPAPRQEAPPARPEPRQLPVPRAMVDALRGRLSVVLDVVWLRRSLAARDMTETPPSLRLDSRSWYRLVPDEWPAATRTTAAAAMLMLGASPRVTQFVRSTRFALLGRRSSGVDGFRFDRAPALRCRVTPFGTTRRLAFATALSSGTPVLAGVPPDCRTLGPGAPN